MLLQGKWIWVWNYPRCCGGDPVAIAQHIKDASCVGVLVKSGDGGHDFGQGAPIEEILLDLRQQGIQAEPWEYWYLRDTPGDEYGIPTLTYREEAQHLIATCTKTGAAFGAIDIEGESENAASPTVNARLALAAVKQALSGLELYYAPLAQPNYHPRLPYAAMNEFCAGVLPQAYYNSMGVEPERAIELCYDAFASEGLTSRPLYPAGAADPGVTPNGLIRWSNAAIARGAESLSYWSFEHMTDDLWAAVRQVNLEGNEVDQQARDDIKALQTDEAMQQGALDKMVQDIENIKTGMGWISGALDLLVKRVEALEAKK